MNDQYTQKEKGWRWIKYGVIPSFAPMVIASMYDLYLGYDLGQIITRHFLDFILVIFAIAVGIFSATMDLNNNINKKRKEKYTYNAVWLGLCCIAIYSFLYDKIDGNVYVLNGIRIVFVILSFFIIRNGFRLEQEEREEFLNLDSK